MKIWISDINSATHRIIKLNCETHSDFQYLGDLDDAELKDFFISLDGDVDIEKNTKLLKYYGYLHLFIIKKAKKS